MRGVPWRISQVPGYQNSVFGSLSYNPATDRAVQQIREVGGIYTLGTRFPFASGSQDIIARNTSTETGPKVECDTYEINASQTVTAGASPLWIACRRFKINTSGILTADGLGGAGGTGINADTAAAAGANSYASSQGYFGGSGGGGGGGNSTTATVRAGGSGGKAYAGATAASGGAGAASGTATNGSAGHAARIGIRMLDSYLRMLLDQSGGAGGGAGAGAGAGFPGATGGDGGDGGGFIIITCETFENLGTIRARGTAGTAGGTNSDRSAGGGGGGGGGTIIVLCVQRVALGTLEVDGGAGGAGGNGASNDGGAGGAGADGIIYFEQQYIL